MLENDSWSHSPVGVCNDFCGSNFNKQVISLASNGIKIRGHCFKNGKVSTIGAEICSDIGASMVDGHNFFENDSEEKEPNYLSFGGWPDIFPLDDAESMLRSFGSTFGSGEFGDENEFSWFSSQCIDGSDAVTKSDFSFPFSESSSFKHVVDQDNPSKVVNISSSVNESKYSTSVSSTTKSQAMESKDTVPFNFSTVNHSIDENAMMMNNHKKHKKIYYQSKGDIMKDQYLENGGIGFKALTSSTRPHSFGCLQNRTPFSQPGMKSKGSGVALCSPSMEEFSNFSNGVARMDSSLDICFETPSTSIDDKSKKLNNRNWVDASSYDPTASKQVQVHYYEVESHYEVKGSRKRTLEIFDFSNAPETSCLSSGLATTLEESRLSQLRQVMHQVDIRTKLCLRDGLYRLAKSAEQRRLSANANVRSIDDGVTNGILIDEGATESNELMDIESETNPIDRSIAHLLFYRSLDRSANSACNGSSLKSRTMVDGLIASRPLIT